MEFVLKKQQGKWGILQDDKECVPFCHISEYGAISELIHFEIINIHEKFLPHILSDDEIEYLEMGLVKYHKVVLNK